MTIDERLQSLAMRLEVLTRVHEDFQQRMTEYASDVKDAITRLTNIAAAHSETLDEHEKRIENLEQ